MPGTTPLGNPRRLPTDGLHEQLTPHTAWMGHHAQGHADAGSVLEHLHDGLRHRQLASPAQRTLPGALVVKTAEAEGA